MSKYGLCIRYQIKDANILSADAEKILNFFKFPQKLAELNLQKIDDEKQILEKAYNEYLELKKNNLWGSRKYY